MNVQEMISARGISFWLVEKHDVPVASIHFAWKGGVETNPPAQQGLAKLATAMLMEGAGDLDATAFQGQLADHGISLNIDATRDYIQGQLYALTADMPKAIDLTQLALTKPRLEAEAFTRTRAQQLSSIKQSMAEPDWQARYRLMQTVFGGHPYALRGAGTATTLATIGIDDVKTFYLSHIARDNLHVVVVGDMTADNAKTMVDQLFGALPDKSTVPTVPQATWPSRESPTGQTIWVKRKGAQTIWQWALPGVDDDDPDWFAANVVNYVWGGGGFSSRLMQEVREEQGLTYGIGTGLSAMEHGNVWMGKAALADDKVSHAMTYVQGMIARLHQGGLTQDEVDGAKTYLINSLMLDLTSSRGMAQVLLDWKLSGRAAGYLAERTQGLQAVTLEHANRVAKKMLDPAAMLSVLVGSPPSLPPGVTAKEALWQNE